MAAQVTIPTQEGMRQTPEKLYWRSGLPPLSVRLFMIITIIITITDRIPSKTTDMFGLTPSSITTITDRIHAETIIIDHIIIISRAITIITPVIVVIKQQGRFCRESLDFRVMR